jgi:ketosteroid isomerase-like protein
MAGIDVVERGYQAAAAGDREALSSVFTDDVVWHLMNRAEVARTYDGREAVVKFLLSFKDLRLESIMALDEIVVAAHSFSAGRAIAATAYEFRDELVASAKCSDVGRRLVRD